MTDIVDPVLEKYAEAHTTPPPPHLVEVDRQTRETLDFPGDDGGDGSRVVSSRCSSTP